MQPAELDSPRDRPGVDARGDELSVRDDVMLAARDLRDRSVYPSRVRLTTQFVLNRSLVGVEVWVVRRVR